MSDTFTANLTLPSHLVYPLEFHEDVPFLRGQLDGKPCLMLLDSGAPNINLNSARIPESKLTEDGELMGAAGKISPTSPELKS